MSNPSANRKWRPRDLHSLTEDEALRLSRMNPDERNELVDELMRDEFLGDPVKVWALGKTHRRIRLRKFFGLRTDGPTRALIFFRYLGQIPGPVWAASRASRRTRFRELFGVETDGLTEVQIYLRYLQKFRAHQRRR